MSAAAYTATFGRLASGKLIVHCIGSFPHRALPLTALVGTVRVGEIAIAPDGSSFIGALLGTPQPGDELVVRYVPEPPTRTGVRYPAPTVS